MEIKRIEINGDIYNTHLYPENGLYIISDKGDEVYIIVNKDIPLAVCIGLVDIFKEILEPELNFNPKDLIPMPKEENTEHNGMVSEKFVIDLIKAIK